MAWRFGVFFAANFAICSIDAVVGEEGEAAPANVGATGGVGVGPAGAASSGALVLRGGLRNPFPGGVMAGYAGDTGLDISGFKKPVFSIASGTVDYSEWGHTLWRGPKDTAFCIRVRLDAPILFSSGRVRGKITHVYYAHLSALEFTQAEGAASPRHVSAGDKLGTSGIANGSPHLHVGLLLDGQVEQDDWKYILTEAEIRKVFGNYKPGEKI